MSPNNQWMIMGQAPLILNPYTKGFGSPPSFLQAPRDHGSIN
jgi:hypothetical protein